MQAPDLAVKELIRCKKELGKCCILLNGFLLCAVHVRFAIEGTV